MINCTKIVGSSCTGKTRKLLEMAKADPHGVLVCSNPYSMIEKAIGYGIFGVSMISYEEYLNDYNHKKEFDNNYYIDDIDSFILEGCDHVIAFTDNVEWEQVDSLKE